MESGSPAAKVQSDHGAVGEHGKERNNDNLGNTDLVMYEVLVEEYLTKN